jgi:membrane peptidoglycan carboxypeptidase
MNQGKIISFRNLSIFFLLAFDIFAQGLPPINISYASYVVTSDQRVLGYIGDKNRVEVKSTGYIARNLIYALVATEDRDFYNHDGVSVKGLARAAIQTVTGHTQGGSTLTMQLVKNLFLTREKTIDRKLTEIKLAGELEKKYSKDQILLLYLNTVYFGRGAYGIWAASQEFFSKTPDKLNVLECALLAGLLQSPVNYDPSKHPDKALKRRNEVLHNLVEVNKLSEKEFNRLKTKPLGLKLREHMGFAYLEMIKREANEVLRHQGKSISSDKYKITVSLDYDMQSAAERIISSQWKALPKQMQQAQIGLVSVEPGTGKILAMVTANPNSDQVGLNRAFSIKRQPGSSFKAFLYGAMLEKGYTLDTPLLDSAIVFNQGTPFEWRPQNDNETFSNTYMPLTEAVKHSVNAAAAYAEKNFMPADSICSFARRLGITSQLMPVPSVVLGTSEVSPVEMANAFAVFGSSGYYSKPFGLLKIEDAHSFKTLYYANCETKQTLDSATCFLVSTALKGVIDGGTAAGVKKYYPYPAAGKTGTTQNFTDAWFIGYTPFASTAVWVGFDDPKNKLSGAYKWGGTISAPIWGKIMGETFKKRGIKNRDFPTPSSIHYTGVCSESGKIAGDKCLKKNYIPVNQNFINDICTSH